MSATPKPPDGHGNWLDYGLSMVGMFGNVQYAREELRALRQRVSAADDFYRDFLRWADGEDPHPTRMMLETRARAALRAGKEAKREA